MVEMVPQPVVANAAVIRPSAMAHRFITCIQTPVEVSKNSWLDIYQVGMEATLNNRSWIAHTCLP
jgi:hypothetical protein